MTVRVRFAPSPTGYLHVGGLRTALYNYLFARKHGGKFILRIEDTDRNRYVEGAIENLIKSLRWCGLDFDEGPGAEGEVGPYIQSERLEMYQKFAQQLIDNGQAYYAFDTAEELQAMREKQEAAKVPSVQYDRENMRNSLSHSADEVQKWMDEGQPHVVRLKIPDQDVFQMHDLVRGDIEFRREHVDDQVLLKSDGFPTYHLASVVDDHHMGITHIIRGEEWLSSVPRHLVMYNYFGWEVPKMVHLPLLLNKDKSKLSKRQNDVAVEDYLKKGYQADALVNFVALLGWNPGDDREEFTMDELVEAFSVERINKSGAVFEIDKLNWFNKRRVHGLSVETLAEQARPYLEEAGFDIPSEEYLLTVMGLLQERLGFVHEAATLGSYFFQDPDAYDPKAVKKRWKANSSDLAREFATTLESLDNFDAAGIEAALQAFAEEREMKAGPMFIVSRLSVSGMSGGPDLFPMMATVGQEAVVRRLRLAADRLAKDE